MRAPKGTPLDAFSPDRGKSCCTIIHVERGVGCTRPAGHEPPHVATTGTKWSTDWLVTWCDNEPESPPDPDDGLSPALREARAQRPTVGVFGSDDDDMLEYRLIIHDIVYDATFKDGKLVAWYIYDRNTKSMLGSS